MRFLTCLAAALATLGAMAAVPVFAWQPDALEQLFTRLTAHAWDNNVPGAFGHTEQLVLRRDGTYRWTRTSDVTERDESGNWSLLAHNSTSGLLRLSDTGDLPFRLEAERLRLVTGQFRQGDPIAPSDQERKLTAADLKAVKAGELAVRLASTVWVKTNPFDDFYLPDRLEFSADGRYRAVHRGGQCQHRGLWGLEYRKNRNVDFCSLYDDNSCDQRGGSAGLTHDLLRFSGELLLLGSSYAPEAKNADKIVFVFDRYGDTLLTRGEFVGPLGVGKPVKIEFTHESASGQSLDMKTLEIGFQKMRIIPRGGVTEGPMQCVVRKDLSGKTVTPAAVLRYTVEVTPPFAGEVYFSILPRFANSSQTFDAVQSYVTTIGQ